MKGNSGTMCKEGQVEIIWNPMVPWDCGIGWTVGHKCICKRDRCPMGTVG